MRIINVGAFVLASTAMLASGFFLLFGQPSGEFMITSPDSASKSEPFAQSANSSAREPLPSAQQNTNHATMKAGSDAAVDIGESSFENLTNDSPATVPPDNYVETYLTSSELNALHTQLLSSFTSHMQSDMTQSIRVNTLGLDRSQRHQVFLEPEDEIILINDTPVADLASDPAVGSMLAGPAMKLAVQRGAEVFEVQLSSY
ncbi:hypothetical protein [Marinobacter sp. CHS3-4]|uniref:hypothetical protein n=1 Tax=Marinobacter sp. CHS3-4 TaxID=3045174 RepID=UPI0024B52F24|nr:hypothetical protein [Marinobacter sp. CHS3-4]MDI9246014.1 hypothetical protein [Marinobacter sp. CHS3-4]